jgi:cytochrome c5
VPEHTDAVLEAELSVEAASLLPLLSGGKIACWTCHDVHTSDTPTLPRRRSQLGDRLNVPAPPPQPTGEKQKERSTMLALPAADGRLCQACHGTGPK